MAASKHVGQLLAHWMRLNETEWDALNETSHMGTRNRNMVTSGLLPYFYAIFLGSEELPLWADLTWRGLCEGFPRTVPAVMAAHQAGYGPAAGTGHSSPARLGARADTGTWGQGTGDADGLGHQSCPLGTGQIGTCPFRVPHGPAHWPRTAQPWGASRRGPRPRAVFGSAAKGTGRASRGGGKVPRKGSPSCSRWEEAPPCPGRGRRAASRHWRGAGESRRAGTRPSPAVREPRRLQVSDAGGSRHGAPLPQWPPPLRPPWLGGGSACPAEEHPHLLRLFWSATLNFSTSDSFSTLCPPVVPCFAGSPLYGPAAGLERRLVPHLGPPGTRQHHRIPMNLKGLRDRLLLSECQCLATA